MSGISIMLAALWTGEHGSWFFGMLTINSEGFISLLHQEKIDTIGFNWYLSSVIAAVHSYNEMASIPYVGSAV